MARAVLTFLLGACAVALLLAGCARSPEPTSPDPSTHPPSTFLEAEPDNVDVPNRVTVTLAEGLFLTMHAKPVSLGGGGWGFEIALEFQNRLVTQGVFDLGPEPVVVFTIAVTLPNGGGFGSGGGCAFGSSLHGHSEQALAPGQRKILRDSWMAGLEAEQVLEAGISLCHVRLPDGRLLSGPVAQIDAVVDAESKLTKFELRALAVPQPEPRAG
jgi:hypothetical protein